MSARSYTPLIHVRGGRVTAPEPTGFWVREEDAPLPRDFDEQVTEVFDAASLCGLQRAVSSATSPDTDVHEVPAHFSSSGAFDRELARRKRKNVVFAWTTIAACYTFSLIVCIYLLSQW